MQIRSFRDRSQLPARSLAATPKLPPATDTFRAAETANWSLLPRVLVVAVGAVAATQAIAAQAHDPGTKLIAGVEDMRSGRVVTPQYLGGSSTDWKGNVDHCYSIYFRVAIRQGLVSESQAEQLMARMHSGQPGAFLQNLFPHGFETLTLRGAQVEADAIPAGYLVSMDGGDHVMMSTGRLTESGEHEVYSFKGGGVETPVWGDSVGYDPAAKIHKTTVESELRALQQDGQPIDQVILRAGRSALQP